MYVAVFADLRHHGWKWSKSRGPLKVYHFVSRADPDGGNRKGDEKE